MSTLTTVALLCSYLIGQPALDCREFVEKCGKRAKASAANECRKEQQKTMNDCEDVLRRRLVVNVKGDDRNYYLFLPETITIPYSVEWANARCYIAPCLIFSDEHYIEQCFDRWRKR